MSGAWDPGIESTLPAALRPLCTILRADNVFTSAAEARELSDLTGLPESEIVAFNPRRLALHELLVRITADFSVPDGERIEDLGINFREIARVALEKYLEPKMDVIVAAYEDTQRELSQVIDAELSRVMAVPLIEHTHKRGRLLPFDRGRWLKRFIHRPRDSAVTPAAPCGPAPSWDAALLEHWQLHARSTEPGLEAAAHRALGHVMLALLNRHGQPWGTREIIAALAVRIACNDAASEAIGNAIEPLLLQAAREQGYLRLACQPHPIVMNTKGPSASGKSSLRPLQRNLSGELGIRWRDFALISPDIWRKQLLDYRSLGADYKYAGALTADELRIVDQKLDRYMARKAHRGEMSHLLIDRFRFDSFAADSYEAGSNLLTRFGHVVYLFFMITPPVSLVERAWTRGLEVGRYKAVDDTLAHGVEAYSGMPDLLFTWIRRTDKRVHFEFLDNSVPLGDRPRTVAFGSNETLNVLDVNALLDVERYRKVNINAPAASALYADREILRARHNLGFFAKCIERFREVHFALQSSGRIYLTLIEGKPAFVDAEPLTKAIVNSDTRAALFAVAASVFDRRWAAADRPRYLRRATERDEGRTVGQWGCEGVSDDQ